MKTQNHIEDEQIVKRANEEVKLALYKKKVTETPIIIYDRKTKTIYSINPDGTRKVLCTRETAGRYSERCKQQ